jgi:heme O synthase-like polyprenyltransferase
MSEQSERVEPSLSTRIDEMLTEARVILPGAQALLGFQLIIVLTSAFASLPALSKLIHALALGTMALTVILLVTPAAYHRIVYDGEHSEDMHRTGSRLVTAATIPLALGMVGDVYVTIQLMSGSTAVGIAAAAFALAVLAGLWLVYPLAMRQRSRPVRRRIAHRSG